MVLGLIESGAGLITRRNVVARGGQADRQKKKVNHLLQLNVILGLNSPIA